jgi:hypothetical protein
MESVQTDHPTVRIRIRESSDFFIENVGIAKPFPVFEACYGIEDQDEIEIMPLD